MDIEIYACQIIMVDTLPMGIASLMYLIGSWFHCFLVAVKVEIKHFKLFVNLVFLKGLI